MCINYYTEHHPQALNIDLYVWNKTYFSGSPLQSPAVQKTPPITYTHQHLHTTTLPL